MPSQTEISPKNETKKHLKSREKTCKNRTIIDTAIFLTFTFLQKPYNYNKIYCNVFKKAELEEELGCRYFRHTTPHGTIQGKNDKHKEIRKFRILIISFFY